MIRSVTLGLVAFSLIGGSAHAMGRAAYGAGGGMGAQGGYGGMGQLNGMGGRGSSRRGGGGGGGVGGGSTQSPVASCYTTQAAGSAQYGIILNREPRNGNALAADTYLLDAQNRKVKQVGHADVGVQSESDSTILLSVANTADSPFAFALTISSASTSDATSASPSDTGEPTPPSELTGTLATGVLFSGDTLSNDAVNCRVSERLVRRVTNPSAPAPAPSSAPSATPSGTS
jgi:hypothetical protein